MENFKKFIVDNNGSSGKMYNEKYVKNNHINIYNDVINYCQKNLYNLPFKEKVYHYLHDIKHEIVCKNPCCNNLVKYHNSTLGYHKYCSYKCISSDPGIKKIKENKSYEKFGTKAPCMNENIKNKLIETNKKKYGTNSPLQNLEIIEKCKKTLMSNYGVDNPNKSKEISKKRIESFKKSNYRSNYKKTMLEKYGVNYPYECSEFLEKSKETLMRNYGVVAPYLNKKILEKSQTKKLETWLKKKYLNENIIYIDYVKREYTMKCDCGKDHEFKISFSLLKSRRSSASHFCTICFPTYFNQTSMMEQDLIFFIENNYNYDLQKRNNYIISPYEVDIYLPTLNKAIEFNGLYWHSDKFKDINYHYNKYELCKNKNIKLITIYEDDWIHKQDIIKSMIIDEIHKTTTIPNINVIIKEIEELDIIKNFMEENSLYDFNENFSYFGLYQNEELINMLMFKIENDTCDIYFIHKNFISIKNGTKILFDYLKENYKIKKFISVVERDFYDNEYFNLGFKINSITNPNYKFVVKKQKREKRR